MLTRTDIYVNTYTHYNPVSSEHLTYMHAIFFLNSSVLKLILSLLITLPINQFHSSFMFFILLFPVVRVEPHNPTLDREQSSTMTKAEQ